MSAGESHSISKISRMRETLVSRESESLVTAIHVVHNRNGTAKLVHVAVTDRIARGDCEC